MIKVRKDLTGQKFGRLTVMYQTEDYVSSGQKYANWHCKCDCGNEKDVIGFRLTNGSTHSCGCYRKEYAKNLNLKVNTYDLTGSYGIGYTSNNKEFYFDLEDYPKIKDYCWRLRKDGYLDAKIRDGSGKRIMMHDLIMGQKYIDHIGGIKTRNDNRKSNLRIPIGDYSFDSFNQMNKQVQSNNKSGYPGISWHKRDNIWEVHITIKKKQIYIGRYENLDDAIKARKDAEKKYFGEYSYQNSQEIYHETQKLNDYEKEKAV